ncbi:MAG: monovalent cation/H+ antiporter subunit D [Persicimonas sp.]
MSDLLIYPILIPIAGALLIPLIGWGNLKVQRGLSIVATLATVVVAFSLVDVAMQGEILTYEVGDWAAPFGITLVLDRLSAMMVALTSIVAVVALLYASQGHDERGTHFHFLFQMQVLGINGAFLTGDLFNLFVFFEVLLLASYALLLFGRTDRRVAAGVHYVVLNLAGSALFIIAVGIMYGLTGTLNMADMAEHVAELGSRDEALVHAGALLLLVVFGLKAALLPLFLWLPNVYSAASAPVAALFAILTKVGVYAILRVTTLIFGDEAGIAAGVAEPYLLPLALGTLFLGTLGVLASKRLGRTIGYLIIASLGTMLAAVGLYSSAAIGAALYYVMHSTLIGAGLFLLVEVIADQRGETEDRLVVGPELDQPSLLGVVYFICALAVAGLPPLSGFVGKALILDAAIGQAGGFWVLGIIVATSLLTVVALAQAGIEIFWKAGTDESIPPAASHPARGRLVPIVIAVAIIAALTIGAGPVTEYTMAAADQLLEPQNYIRAVLY